MAYICDNCEYYGEEDVIPENCPNCGKPLINKAEREDEDLEDGVER